MQSSSGVGTTPSRTRPSRTCCARASKRRSRCSTGSSADRKSRSRPRSPRPVASVSMGRDVAMKVLAPAVAAAASPPRSAKSASSTEAEAADAGPCQSPDGSRRRQQEKKPRPPVAALVAASAARPRSKRSVSWLVTATPVLIVARPPRPSGAQANGQRPADRARAPPPYQPAPLPWPAER